jgi:transcriptional regulator with XRE-family HTH domain
MAKTGILDGYISRADLAAELGYAFETLIRWEKDGRGPPVTRIGRKVLYLRTSLKKWFEAQEGAAKGAAGNTHVSAA